MIVHETIELGFLFLQAMILFYNLGIRLYFFFIRLASLYKEKAKLFVAGRRSVFEELGSFAGSNDKPIAWFHAASLGEFEQGLPVMEAYKKEHRSKAIIVTFFSPSGYEQRKTHPIADFTCYLPMDTKLNAKRFLDTINPEAVFFIKYEYWYYYLKEISIRSIPLYSISALFTPNHIFFKSYGSFYRKMLEYFKHTFVQNTSSLDLIKNVGISEASVSGDTRFDRVLQTTASPEHYPEIVTFKGDAKLCIIGSAWPSDMRVLLSFINQSSDELKFIIAPHLIDGANVEKVMIGLAVKTYKYSGSKDIPHDTKVLMLDTMGMLSSVYQYGDFAYIGGAFGDGLHNILEAVTFGLPVVYGDKGLEKFPESLALQQLKGGFVIKNESEANHILTQLTDDKFRQSASKICKDYISNNAGATQHIMAYLTSEQS